MNVERIAQLINQGEGLTTEFKKAGEGLPQSLFETICAFLNKAGGTILLGVTDDKNVAGVNPEKAEQYCKDIANTSGRSFARVGRSPQRFWWSDWWSDKWCSY